MFPVAKDLPLVPGVWRGKQKQLSCLDALPFNLFIQQTAYGALCLGQALCWAVGHVYEQLQSTPSGSLH